MNMRGVGRRLRQTFGISAPRMAVRTHLSWRWKMPALVVALALVIGMWWWGFDFGQFLGGFNRGAVAEKQERLESELAAVRQENLRLRDHATRIESDLGIARGAQTTASRQALDLQNENSQIKEELAFLQRLFSDTGKLGTMTIQRLTAERQGENSYHYSVLIVRGGNPNDEFSGRLALLATVVAGTRPSTISLPDDQIASADSLRLYFKYYQRVEGTLPVPPGAQLKSLQAKVIEDGQAAPKVSRSLNVS